MDLTACWAGCLGAFSADDCLSLFGTRYEDARSFFGEKGACAICARRRFFAGRKVRLRSSLRVRPVQCDNLGPAHSPVACDSGSKGQGHAPGGDNQPRPGAQYHLAQTVQAPSGSARLCNGAPGDMHDLIGYVQANLVAGKGIDVRGSVFHVEDHIERPSRGPTLPARSRVSSISPVSAMVVISG